MSFLFDSINGPESPDYGPVGGTDMGYSAPTALRDLDVVVVGGGPSGLFAAAVLHGYGIRTTVIERQEREPKIDVSRSYLFALNQRGQAIVRKKPKLFPALLKGTTTPDGYSWCLIPLDGSAKLNPYSLPRKFKPGMLFFRPRFISEMRTFLANECPDVRVLYSSSIQNISFSSEGHSVLEIKHSDGTCHTIRTKLVLACDGINSAVASALRNGPPDVVTSSQGPHYEVLYSSGVGFEARGIIVKENLLSHIEKVPESLDRYWVSVKGRSFDFQILPMLSTDKERVGGMLASISLPPGHPLFEEQSADTVYSALQQNFPQLHIRQCITEESIQAFIAGRLVRFPEVKRIKSLVSHVGQDGGVVIIGDAAHSFPPDAGQGLNSSMEDVAEFAAALSSASKSASLQDVISDYEKRRSEDITGLVEIASLSGRRTYKRSPMAKRLFSAELTLRDNLATYFPFLFYPPSAAMNSLGWRYSVSHRRHELTTWRMIIFACLVSLIFIWMTRILVRTVIRQIGG